MPINPGHSAFSESPNIRDATPARDEVGRFTPGAKASPPPQTPLKTYPAFNSKGESIRVTIPEDAATDAANKYTEAQHRQEAAKLVARFNDFEDLYDEAKSDIRPMMASEGEWDGFLRILSQEWNKRRK